MFDTLIDDAASQFGLGSNSGPLIRELLSLVAETPGGVGGFLNNMKAAGLSSEVASWMGNTNSRPLAAAQVDRALGTTALSGIANRLGLPLTLVVSAAGYALPKVIGLLTPGGVIPRALPAETTNFVNAAESSSRLTAPFSRASRAGDVPNAYAAGQTEVYPTEVMPSVPVLFLFRVLMLAVVVLGVGFLITRTVGTITDSAIANAIVAVGVGAAIRMFFDPPINSYRSLYQLAPRPEEVAGPPKYTYTPFATVVDDSAGLFARDLRGVSFPASKQDLLRYARASNAGSDVLHAMEGLADRNYVSANDVLSALDLVR